MEAVLGPIIKSGRAAFGVVLKGYIERLHPSGYVFPDLNSVEYLERVVNRVTDLRRGLDYLETRKKDIDMGRLAFYGPSAGAQIGLVLAAVEPRYRGVVLAGAGLRNVPRIAEADPASFAPHIRAPKLILQGRYDEDTPLKTQTEPMLKILPDPTRVVVYDGGHVPPPALVVSSVGGFLDQLLGPVKR
jgi:pimeloyl-ACP methyl ester carboxylesterase